MNKNEPRAHGKAHRDRQIEDVAHGEELQRLIHNEEAREAQDHPLQRIMQIESAQGVLTVTTTDVHLARRIGEALHAAFHGELTVKYNPDEYLVRVNWTR